MRFQLFYIKFLNRDSNPLLKNLIYQHLQRKPFKFFMLNSCFLHENGLYLFSLKVFLNENWYSMKIKEQTRKLAVGCSKYCFEVVDETDEVSNIYIRQGDADVV